MIYLDLDLDLDLNEVLKIFICLVFKLNLSTFNSLSSIELSTYLVRTYILQYQHPTLFAQVYNQVYQVYQVYNQVGLRNDQLFSIQNPDPSATGSSTAAPSAFPSSAASFNTLIAPDAASSSIATLYTPVASVSGSDRKRKLTDEKPDETNEKKYKCNVCDYATNMKSHLTTHTRVHTREKPFKCPQCNYAAAQKIALDDHINTHGNTRPHKCQHCDHRFNSHSSLYRHMKKYH